MLSAYQKNAWYAIWCRFLDLRDDIILCYRDKRSYTNDILCGVREQHDSGRGQEWVTDDIEQSHEKLRVANGFVLLIGRDLVLAVPIMRGGKISRGFGFTFFTT